MFISDTAFYDFQMVTLQRCPLMICAPPFSRIRFRWIKTREWLTFHREIGFGVIYEAILALTPLRILIKASILAMTIMHLLSNFMVYFLNSIHGALCSSQYWCLGRYRLVFGLDKNVYKIYHMIKFLRCQTPFYNTIGRSLIQSTQEITTMQSLGDNSIINTYIIQITISVHCEDGRNH